MEGSLPQRLGRTIIDPLVTSARTPSRRELVTTIVLFRLVYLLCMSTSDFWIPDHNPGDDVLRFDLRLEDYAASKQHEELFHFCRSEHCWLPLITFSKDGVKSTASSFQLLPTQAWKFILSPLTKWDAARFLHLAAFPTLRGPPLSCLQGDAASCNFADSEQAHAFFPLFPSLVRMLALRWMKVAPTFLLPPTFECLVVLSGIFVNTLCLLVSTLSLYSLTISILPATTVSTERKQQIATTACLVYSIWNPASVFFATNYSESLFGALALTGHVAFAQGWLSVALICWHLASWTRSNGTIHCLWLMFQVLGHVSQLLLSRRVANTSDGIRKQQTVGFILVKILVSVGGIVLIFLPLRYHDQHGYSRHCDAADTAIRPAWCEDESPSFSLYAWTQRQHWNVGLFRYFEVKQIPNFLLAAPILGLSTLGVILWIRASILAYGNGKMPTTPYMVLIGWPLHALADAVGATQDTASFGTTTLAPQDYLIHNPKLLGHYAILAGLTLLGLLVAHVQITTRMICSSSPAAIWFLTYCHLQDKHPNLRLFVRVYTALYMLLGVILHVNFLPWT